jgi:hypothetical protein
MFENEQAVESEVEETVEETESIEAFEERVSTEGYETSDDSTEAEEIETADEETAEAESEQLPLPGMAEFLKAQSDLSTRQTELLERLAAVKEPSKATPKAETALESYNRLLNDRHSMASAMEHPDVGLDPTDTNHVALFRNMVHNLILEEQTNTYNSKLQALESKLQQWEHIAVQRQRAQVADTAWKAATSEYAMDAELAETLHAAALSLIQEGTDPKQAIQAVIRPFAKILPKKGTTAAARPIRSPEAARGIAVAAVAGRGANTNQAFRRGTTTSRSIADLENKIFGLE